MLRTAWKSFAANRTRMILTALSVVLGVAFVAGSFVFTDTINARFETLFSDVYAGVDATVRSDATGSTASFDESVLADVAGVDGVSVAAGAVSGFAQVIDPTGEPIGGQGPPTLGFSWVDEASLNALRIDPENGRPPTAPGEVAIDVATAEANGFSVGDQIDVQTRGGVEQFALVGLANFGTEDNLAGATLTAFELTDAQRLFGLEGRLTSIDVLAEPEIAAEELIARVGAVVPSGAEVVTGEQQTLEEIDEVTAGLGFLGNALLAFAGVAIFVGAFVIQNTFRITVAQRVRELALLRAIGATGSQIITMVLAEAATLAVLASAVGVAAGLGISELIAGGMRALGIDLPDGPLTLEPRTILVAMAVGIVVTMVAAVLPARRASMIAPVAALSEGSAPSTPHSLRTRTWLGGALTAAGVATMGIGLLAENGAGLALVAAGAVGVFLGLSTLAPLVARPVARVISAPFRGISAKLARENTIRQPRRTASTASALMIGVALVVFVSIFAASIRASVADTVDSAFPADLALTSSNLTVGLSAAALEELRSTPEIETISAVSAGHFEIAAIERNVAGVDPDTIGAVYDAGPSIAWHDLGDGMLVHADVLDEQGWEVGDVVDVRYHSGESIPTEIAGTISDQTFAGFIVSAETFRRHIGDDQIQIAFAALTDGVALDEGVTAATGALSAFPNIDVNTKSDQIAQAEASVDQLVALFSGLLSLALLIALFGIANTLALSIVERTREIGLLRAVGMARRQVRTMIRWEAVTTALFGAVMGVGIGTAIGFGVVSSLADDGLGSLSIPGGQLAAWLVVSAIAGVAASILPARKAARMNVLAAIAHD